MARIPKPWYREDRQAWFVTIRGERHNLGSEEQEAQRRFHELMAKKPEDQFLSKPAGLSVAGLFEKFLEWSEKNQAPRTYEWYRIHIQGFIDHLGQACRIEADALRPYHIQEWLDAHPDWGSTYRHGAIRSVQRPFNWAIDLGYLEHSPIRRLKKPSPNRREQAVTPEQWQQIREHYPDGDPFRDFLEFCYDTGCRPYEARIMEPQHVHLGRLCVLFPPDEAKGKKRWRIIRLTATAAAVIKKHMADRTEGKVFLNAQGRPWTAYAINCRFCRLQIADGRRRMKELGITLTEQEVNQLMAKLSRTRLVGRNRVAKTDAELREEARAKVMAKLAKKHASKCFAYAFRHGFATRKLIAGHDHLTVAEWRGHADGTMLAKVYAHLDQADAHLRKALDD
jgi:integrase